MNKSESKYFNTAVKMDKAFLKLLDEKEFEYITIKEICALAGVNRSTFYLHYETVGDLLQETMEYVQTLFQSYFKEMSIDITALNVLPLQELYLITPQYLIPWLNFTKEHRKLFQTFFKRYQTLRVADVYEEMFIKILKPILTRYGIADKNQPYVSLFYIEGIMGIVKQWIRNDCKDGIEEIATLIIECVKR